MRKGTRASLASTILAVLLMVLATIAGTSTANAAADSRAAFVAEAREAGLSAKQAAGLQNKADAYLAKLGDQVTQISPNQINLKGGAVLNLTVPGEKQPRQLGDVGALAEGRNSTECIGGARYGWFCAYALAGFGGENIGMFRCGVTWGIPWVSVGSWDNNQTPGTQPLLTFTNGTTWVMPAARSSQPSGVAWRPVASIRPC